MEEKSKYSAEELKEFETLINEKLVVAKQELATYRNALTRKDDEGTDSTTGTYVSLDDGSDTAEKESLNELASRQSKYIKNLENALARIHNGTYGICAKTGKLISKERLKAVPHTTQSIEAKMTQYD